MNNRKPQALLAFDLGASSGRGIIGRFQTGQLTMAEIHRFDNRPITENGHLCWDLPTLVTQIKLGIKKASESYELLSIAIDTWGVDYGLLDHQGQLLRLPVHYRDSSSQQSYEKLQDTFDAEKLFAATGNQVMAINSLFRLACEESKEQAAQLLLMPDLLGYLLTGKVLGEKTIASTTQLLDPITGDWHQALAAQFGIRESLLPNLGQAGDFVGVLQDPELPEIPVYKSYGHDTACAVASVPTAKEEFLFISLGTWALAGTETAAPVLEPAAQQLGFSNEGGRPGRNRFLKNLTGLWLIQELQRSLARTGTHMSFQEMMELARSSADTVLIDTQQPQLAQPEHMLEKLTKLMQAKGCLQPTVGEVIRCVYRSLATAFAQTFAEIHRLTGKTYEEIHIIGGGARADFLCQCIAETCHRPVIAGPVEATAMGNLAAQGIGLGYLTSIHAFRRQLTALPELKCYQPTRVQVY
ncbi:rhamnulokinase [Candidatus Enterococcus leclercqii]|uniref:rhamnulokinase n=1 Tax=Candidatus Enterococcus leclercqii TaxID=1857218 RepID=UPI00137B887E|nr:rhamnulokinase family protein [Enterococcus sp. CU9D]KAF1293388.1 hypothetical protein BAU14_01340 [Enterococcus sp. CU9D]